MSRQRELLAELVEALLDARRRTCWTGRSPTTGTAAADDAARLRVVVDQVASLTDASAVDLARRLVGPGRIARGEPTRSSGCRSTPPSSATRPTSLRYEVVDPTEHVPDSVARGRVLRAAVPRRAAAVADVLPRMTSLVGRADADRRRRQHPRRTCRDGRHALQRPRHPRHLDRRARADADPGLAARDPGLRPRPGPARWEPGWQPALADKRVLLVGYGAVGAAVEARLRPFEVEVVRVARRRPGRRPRHRRAARAAARRGRRGARRTAHRRHPRPGRRRVPRPDEGRRAAGQRRPRRRGRDRRPGRRARRPARITAALDVVDPEPLPPDTRCGPLPAC